MPESTPRRQEILLHLENMEIWHADKISVGWSVETIGPTSSIALQEGDGDDDGLQALVTPPTGDKALRIYLKNEKYSTCLPLEFAEQLAAFCRVKDRVGLIYFILSQENSSYIEQALDRRDIPKTREKKSWEAEATLYPASQQGNKEGKDGTGDHCSASTKEPQVSMAPGRYHAKIWYGGDDEQREDEEPKVDIISDDEEAISDIDQTKSQWGDKTLLALDSTDNEAAESRQTGPAAPAMLMKNGQHIVPKPRTTALATPMESTSRWLNYIALDDAPLAGEYERTQKQPPRQKPKPQVVAGSRGIGKFERPRIVSSRVTFVRNPQELPLQSFSDRAPEGITLPGRAQISQSGDCTIFLAVEPTNKLDTYTEFVGEIFVSFINSH